MPTTYLDLRPPTETDRMSLGLPLVRGSEEYAVIHSVRHFSMSVTLMIWTGSNIKPSFLWTPALSLGAGGWTRPSNTLGPYWSALDLDVFAAALPGLIVRRIEDGSRPDRPSTWYRLEINPKSDPHHEESVWDLIPILDGDKISLRRTELCSQDYYSLQYQPPWTRRNPTAEEVGSGRFARWRAKFGGRGGVSLPR